MQAVNADAQQPTRNARRWQRFLNEQRLEPGPIDGVFGTQTAGATARFQARHGLPESGAPDPVTLEAARDLGFDPEPEIGPDRPGDLRFCRPYFLVPLLELAEGDDFRETRARIARAVEGQNITDVYVLSHGWHRNLFGGVAAYDRLVARFAALRRRGRLRAEADYAPLFLTLHWRSDPGEDGERGWVDRAGRRNKASFLRNVRAAFAPAAGPSAAAEAQFLTDFEDMFELFSCVSAPGVDALADELDKDAAELIEALDARYEVRGGPGATRAEKVALVWACYHESDIRRVLVDQGQRPARFNNPGEALATLLKFVLGMVGIGAVLAYAAWPESAPRRLLARAAEWLVTRPGIAPLWDAFRAAPWWAQVGIVVLVGLTVLGLNVLWQQGRRKNRSSQGLPVLAFAAWLPVQVVFALPMLAYALVTYVLGGLFAWTFSLLLRRPFPWVFSERFRDDGKKQWHLRDALAVPPRWAAKLLRLAVGKDSALFAVSEALDSQLAFWDMQRKGVAAGRQAGEFLARLRAECPAVAGARFHLIGHSFGGLVVANAARFLARERTPEDRPRLHTLCLLQAAIGSSWFETEPEMVAAFGDGNGGGAIASAYSAYDTANGFFYPLANNSRRAAGFVGLCNVGGDAATGKGYTPVALGRNGLFASLVEPPKLPDLLVKHVKPGPADFPWLLNLDASRLIYDGPVSLGGGHGDIFKDDVIHLTWAVTRLGRLPAEAPAAAHAGGVTLPPGLSLRPPAAGAAAPVARGEEQRGAATP